MDVCMYIGCLPSTRAIRVTGTKFNQTGVSDRYDTAANMQAHTLALGRRVVVVSDRYHRIFTSIKLIKFISSCRTRFRDVVVDTFGLLYIFVFHSP